MNHSEIEDAVRNVLATTLNRKIESGENISRESEPKWDSLKHVEIIFSLEDALGVRFGEEEMVELNSMEKLVTSMGEHLGS